MSNYNRNDPDVLDIEFEKVPPLPSSWIVIAIIITLFSAATCVFLVYENNSKIKEDNYDSYRSLESTGETGETSHMGSASDHMVW